MPMAACAHLSNGSEKMEFKQALEGSCESCNDHQGPQAFLV